MHIDKPAYTCQEAAHIIGCDRRRLTRLPDLDNDEDDADDTPEDTDDTGHDVVD